MIIRNKDDQEEAIKLIKSWKLDKPMELTAKPYKKNVSAAQRALFAIWCRDRAKQSGYGEKYERCLAKLTFGVPIMMRDKDFAAAWEPYQSMPYEKQFKAMEIIEITSSDFMNVQLMTEYMTAFEDDCYEQGFNLTKPKLYQEAMQS